MPALRAFRPRVDPFLRLLQPPDDEHAQERRHRADQKHRLPRVQSERQQVPRRERADAHADQARRDVSPGGKRLQQAKRRRTGVIRNRVGHQRDRQAEHAANAQSGEKAIEAKVPKPGGERAQAR